MYTTSAQMSEMAWRSATGLRDVAGRSALGLGRTAFDRRGFILAWHAAEKEKERSVGSRGTARRCLSWCRAGGPWAAAGAR